MIKPVKSLINFICFSWGSLLSFYSNLNLLHNYCGKISLFMSLENSFPLSYVLDPLFHGSYVSHFLSLLIGGAHPLIVSKKDIQEVNFWDFACLKVIILSSPLIIWEYKSRLKIIFPQQFEDMAHWLLVSTAGVEKSNVILIPDPMMQPVFNPPYLPQKLLRLSLYSWYYEISWWCLTYIMLYIWWRLSI